jgi:hypothetical protein
MMRQTTMTLFHWPNWKKPIGLYWFAHNGMWAFGFRVYALGIEINNNAVWTLTERAR